MNTTDFNIKWQQYLEERFYGLDISSEEVIKFLDTLFETLSQTPNFQYSQIKLKFGKARFYSSLPFRVEKMIEREIDFIISQEKDTKEINNILHQQNANI